jgi:hypothetical protein
MQGSVMARKQWYELRVAGSAGTSSGAASGYAEGIALGENGRLCAVSSGGAKKFGSEQEAIEFLGQTTLPRVFNLEPVRCEVQS